MSEGWQPGDLALCIRAGRGRVKGKIYLVVEVFDDCPASGGGTVVGLVIEGPRNPYNPFWNGAHWCRHFTKVPRHEADEFDHEVIAAMRDEPVTAHSRDAHTIAPAASIHLAFQPIDNSGCDDADCHRFSAGSFHEGSL